MYTQLNKKTSWTNEQDYILENGEPGYDTKEHVLKIGNGENKWSELSPALSLAINEFYDGKIQKEDIETVFEGSIVARVNYQGKELEKLSAGQRVVLMIKGDRAADDIQIETNTIIGASEPWDGSYTKGAV